MGGVEREAPAAEGGIGDDAAPAPAGERDAGEARGVVGRDAEDLLDDLVWQRRRRARALRRHAADLRLFVWLLSRQPAVLFYQNKPPPAISQHYFSLTTNQHQPSATSQTNRLLDWCEGLEFGLVW
jgi:hypothetical protein